MKDSAQRRTVYIGGKRAYQYYRDGHDKPYGVKLPGGKKRWYKTIAAAEKVLDKFGDGKRKGTRVYNVRIKETMIECACGCGAVVTGPHKTRRRKYVDDQHKNAAAAKRKEEKREKRTKELLNAQRERRKQERANKAKSQAKNGHDGRPAGGGSEGDGPGTRPPLSKRKKGGLFSSQPEPEQTKKRARFGLA